MNPGSIPRGLIDQAGFTLVRIERLICFELNICVHHTRAPASSSCPSILKLPPYPEVAQHPEVAAFAELGRGLLLLLYYALA